MEEKTARLHTFWTVFGFSVLLLSAVHLVQADREHLEAKDAALYLLSDVAWPAAKIESNCPDFVEQVGQHLWVWSHGNNRSCSPENRSKQQYTAAYVIDEDADSGKWCLAAVKRFGSMYWVSYFRGFEKCKPLWVGPLHHPVATYATTIKGRFVDFGLGTALKKPSDFDEHFLQDAYSGRYSGDTVYVRLVGTGDPTDAELIDRFNSAVSLLGLTARDIGGQRLVELYLESAYPFQRVFIITKSDQLDALCTFVWSDLNDPSLALSHEEWLRLVAPGVKNGQLLNMLPSSTSPVPLPLPSVIMDKFDGAWMTNVGDSESDGDSLLTRNIFESSGGMLFQLQFSVSIDTGLITEVTIERVLDFSDHFSRTP